MAIHHFLISLNSLYLCIDFPVPLGVDYQPRGALKNFVFLSNHRHEIGHEITPSLLDFKDLGHYGKKTTLDGVADQYIVAMDIWRDEGKELDACVPVMPHSSSSKYLIRSLLASSLASFLALVIRSHLV
jgi:hypothetical protein